jgi:hypothetical protein
MRDRSLRRLPVSPLLLAGLLIVPLTGLVEPAAADTVRLTNGRAYEGVIAEELPEGVRVRLAFGYLVIPHDQVAGVDRSPSALADYLRRRAELAARDDADAADWLALARWARTQDLHQGVREAAARAAEIDPHLAGLEPLLRPFGLVLDTELARWIPLDEAMARRGLVRFEGEWISRAEQRERLAELDRRREREAEAATARRLAAATDRLAAVQETRAYERQTPYPAHDSWYAPGDVVYVPFAVPVLVVPTHPFPGFGHHQRPPHPHPGGGALPPAAPPAPGHGYSSFLSRPPGSLLPPGDPGAPPPSPGRSSSSSSAGG